GRVAVTKSTTPWVTNVEASGTPLTATNYGSPPVESLNVYLVNPITGVITMGNFPSGFNVNNFPATFGVTQSTSPWITNIEASGVPLTSTNFGSPPVEALNCYIVNPTSVTFPSSLAVTQSTSPWVVSLASTTITGTVGVTQSTSPWIVAGGGTAGVPGAAVLAVQGVPGGTAVPVSGTFFQTTQPISIASGQVASGSFAAGAFAVGSFVSGSM